eukprot:COSAG01_NODE_5903_length_3962_cov_9.509973_8_plen_41_part_00
MIFDWVKQAAKRRLAEEENTKLERALAETFERCVLAQALA